MKAIVFPSREKLKVPTPLSVNFVNCFGAPPSIDWLYRFAVPSRVFTYHIDWPSGAHTTPSAMEIRSAAATVSITLTGPFPSAGAIIIRQREPACSSWRYAAIHLPSGENCGLDVNLSITCVGSPPSIETFQGVRRPERHESKRTQRPSGETLCA